MLRELTHTVEQLVIARDHVLAGDANNARFAMMLTDNVVEIALHRRAVAEQGNARHWFYRREESLDPAIVRAGTGRNFDGKIRFAKAIGLMDENSGRLFSVLHGYRNEIYHVGLAHRDVLADLAAFYLDAACRFLARQEPGLIGWSSRDVMPERAAPFFERGHEMRWAEQYRLACISIAESIGHDPARTVTALAEHMNSVVENVDLGFNEILGVGPQFGSREAILESCQEIIAENGNGRAGNEIRVDPVPGWTGRVERLRAERDAGRAIVRYSEFMTSTADFRDALDVIWAAADAYVEEQMEQLREERYRTD